MHIVVPNDSNQRTCNINSTSLPTLTTPSGMIANGTEDVILYCICVIDNIAVGPTIWFFNNILITATQANGNDPYYRNNVPSPFIIPLFSTSNVGTYRCESVGSTSAPGDSITIMLPGMYLCVITLARYIYTCILICVCACIDQFVTIAIR